ncbi:hypothetical protein [Muriicola sp.]|uniref:hypothetical protein n=1 Tax=Muriicola sp. TaxID=2020856 RepID=UPI003C74DE1E
MKYKKRHWLWNIVIVVTVIICLTAFILHGQNWTREEKDSLLLFSGFYFTELRYSEIVNVSMVSKLPEMERLSGFSVWTVEKGIFKDTLQGLEDIRVYVDDLKLPKIKVERKENSMIFFNFKDSLKTVEYFELLSRKITEAKPKQ